MNICLIGDGLTSLALAKNLINKKIKVFLYCRKKKLFKSNSRTIGISQDNLNFFNKEIIKLKKNNFWNIDHIEIYNDSLKKEKILDFKKNRKKLFSILKNEEIYNLLDNNLKKNKLFKKILIKDNNFYKQILRGKKYELIINCDDNNYISKKFFNKKINKNYDSCAYTLIIKHKKIKNSKAVQIFTKFGPIAFLPISSSETSVVFSKVNEKNIITDNDIQKLIIKYNKYYSIKELSKIEKFNLNFSISKNYYYKNVMAFGESLHKIHPLAGQGFNMTLRDIKNFSQIIQDRLDLGLQLDCSLYKEFENKTKHLNFIFSSSIDFIYEFFKLKNKYKNNFSNKIFKILDENRFINNAITSYADKGLFF